MAKRKVIRADEYDHLPSRRRQPCYTQHAGVVHAIKKRLSRRYRREARTRIRRGDEQ